MNQNNTIDTQSLMLQMQSLANQAKGVSTAPSSAQALQQAEQGNSDGFAHLLQQAVSQVNQQSVESEKLKEAFQSGDPDVDLGEVMITAQKASISFQAMVEVRNKLMEAYKDVTNMPV